MSDLTVTDNDLKFMKMACDIAIENVNHGGGPFGCVIVKDGEMIAAAGDSVALDHDPTAHAQVNAIRRACSLTRSSRLEGCVVYSSCEPCSMCMSALYRVGVSCIYYGNSADQIDSSDKFICHEKGKPDRECPIPCIRIEATTL